MVFNVPAPAKYRATGFYGASGTEASPDCNGSFYEKFGGWPHESGSFPRWKSPENKHGNRAIFPGPQKCPSNDQLYHAFHHKLTIKTPRPATVFLKNPCKNTKTSKPPPHQKSGKLF
jgi:hypothetical protein